MGGSHPAVPQPVTWEEGMVQAGRERCLDSHLDEPGEHLPFPGYFHHPDQHIQQITSNAAWTPTVLNRNCCCSDPSKSTDRLLNPNVWAWDPELMETPTLAYAK